MTDDALRPRLNGHSYVIGLANNQFITQPGLDWLLSAP